jgi:hypothetical protein
MDPKSILPREFPLKFPANASAGLAFIYLAFETKNSDCFTVITDLMQKEPRITGRIIHDGLVAWLRTDRGDETKSQHMSRLLHAVFNGDKAVLADLAVDFLVVAHHPEVSAEVSWVTLVQGAGLDPATIAAEQSTRILESLWATAGAPPVVRHSDRTGLMSRTRNSL